MVPGVQAAASGTPELTVIPAHQTPLSTSLTLPQTPTQPKQFLIKQPSFGWTRGRHPDPAFYRITRERRAAAEAEAVKSSSALVCTETTESHGRGEQQQQQRQHCFALNYRITRERRAAAEAEAALLCAELPNQEQSSSSSGYLVETCWIAKGASASAYGVRRAHSSS